MNNQLYVMMVKNLSTHIRSDENQREMEAGRPHMDVFKASEVLSIATGKRMSDVAMDIARAENLVMPETPKRAPEVDSIAGIATEAFSLGKRVRSNPDYYSLSDPLGDFLKKNVYEPYGGK